MCHEGEARALVELELESMTLTDRLPVIPTTSMETP